MDRKAELERKKAKLAAIREEKERRRREKEVKDMEDATSKIVSGQEKDSRRYVLIRTQRFNFNEGDSHLFIDFSR